MRPSRGRAEDGPVSVAVQVASESDGEREERWSQGSTHSYKVKAVEIKPQQGRG